MYFITLFLIKKGKYDDLDVEFFFSSKSGTLYKNMTKEKKALFEPTRVQDQLESDPARVGNTAQLELENFFFVFDILSTF